MRTAEALREAAGTLYPGAEIRILDTFRYASPFLGKVVLGAYMEMLKKSPLLYGFLYARLNTESACREKERRIQPYHKHRGRAQAGAIHK
jgi:hypothetical protein